MKITITDTTEVASAIAANAIIDRLRAKPDLVLGLATGRTMESIYRLLVEESRKGLDFSRCRTVNLDEYVGLAGDSPHSYRAYMTEHLFGPVGIPIEHTHLPEGMASDLALESARYDHVISALGGVDLQLLGLGENGHIGFNEPGSSFASRTRVVLLSEETRNQNAELFGRNADNVPRRALTMGVGTILEARSLLLVATGHAKAEAARRALKDPPDIAVSASALQLHADVAVILDASAGKSI